MVSGKKKSRSRTIVGTILMIMAFAILLSLISFHNQTNLLGPVGDFLSLGVVGSLGLTSYFAAFVFGALSIAVFKSKWFRPILRTVLGLILLVVFLNTLLTLMDIPDPLFRIEGAGGGSLGLLLSGLLMQYTGAAGSYIISIYLLTVAYSIVARKPLYSVPLTAGRGAWRLGRWVTSMIGSALRRSDKPSRPGTPAIKKKKSPELKETAPPVIEEETDAHEPPLIIRDRNLLGDQPDEPLEEPPRAQPEPRKRAGGYKLPPLSLLNLPEKTDRKEREESIIERTRLLEQKLTDFGVSGKVKQVLPGPVVTTYEFEPASGVKVNKIVNLSDDLALGMKAMSVRIVAPVPGKAVVGIEIPNKNREPVYLREILASPKFQNSNAKLALGLGNDILGEPMITDLAQIPHLLIAGATGSGKSVALNSMICSILYKATPQEVKFILIDPKRLELSIYEGIPHLITPVVIDPRKAATALRWAVDEMERRYALLSEKGVRNIKGFNISVARGKNAKPSSDPFTIGEGEESLPYIVVVIDELADLMMVSSREVEDSLTRLAQMARAAGIHLMVATQRPSVDVLTGIIKVNFPARISFQLFSKFDSRTILDSNGAERLLGRGDMLFLRPGTSLLTRIHGPFVSEEEVKRIVEFWRTQQIPEYDDTVLQPRLEDDDLSEDDYDEKYEEAVALVARTGQASISMIQRRLRVGYNRSARMIEIMEREGLVGPADGSKPREVYIKESDLKDR
jgi:S-DNA-T family DNA segregation ATPase FtsK/SpoIIIE